MERRQEAHAVLVGRDVTSTNQKLNDLIPCSLSQNFHFLGEQSDMSTIYPAIDLVCITSRAEAFPNVLGEAMSYG